VTTGVSVLYASGQQGVGFTGTIPPSLLLNPAIRELDLGANNLTGERGAPMCLWVILAGC
jgi:hypothetical protein